MHFMMNSLTLHGVFFTSGLLLVHGLWKLYKKVYFTMKWVGTDKWLTLGFCPANAVSLLGVHRLGGFWPYVIILSHGVGVSLWQPHQLWPLCAGTQWPIYSLQDYCGPATETNWYIQAPAPFGTHDTFPMNNKNNILACWKSWEKLGRHGDRAAKPTRPIKLQSDVNLGLPPASQAESPLHTADTN